MGNRISRRNSWRCWLLPAPLLLLAVMSAAPADADPDYGGPVLPGFDPLLNGTRDARLLGVDRLIVRERILEQGPDPVDGEGLPDYDKRMWHLSLKRAGVDLKRMISVVESSGYYGLETEFRYPTYHFLFQSRQMLPGGYIYYPPRNVDVDEVTLFVDDIDNAFVRKLAVLNVRNRHLQLNAYGEGGIRRTDDGLINLTIPIKIPRTLEKIIGRGEKTSIRISGREHISISGETSRNNRFTATERRQNQSWFPTLDMEQQLQINLSGQIGEKIKLEVDHNSEVIGPDATKIRLTFEGDEDDVIQSIETGDVGLTLPGSQLLGYSDNKSGLFGIKTEGQIGATEFTVVASKQKAESASKSFNSQGGSVGEHIIEAYRYLNNRFFRVDLPQIDLVAHESPDFPGRVRSVEKIDRNSVQVYRFIGAGLQQTGDIRNIVAIPDTTGRWDETYIQDLLVTNPGALQYGELWRPVPFEILIDQDENLVAIDLRHEHDEHDVLAVTYDVEHDDGTRWRVGDKPGEDEDLQVEHDGELYYRMKLLKPQLAERFTWQYVLRNIYPLGGTNIDASTFDLRIELNTFTDFPQRDLTADGAGSGLDWFRIFGLDTEDQLSNPEHDFIVDKHRTVVFDYVRGLLKFPLNFPEPFNAPQFLYEAYADTSSFVFAESQLSDNLIPEIYDWQTNPNDLSNYTQFRLIASHAAASSSFNLGVSNIEEGSETVTLDGRTLTRGTDYEIDYTFGEVTLKGDAAANISPDSQIGVNYQYAPFLGGGNSSLLGFNLNYGLGQSSRMSTTWLYESNQVVGHKAKLGEEPSRTLVGNVNGQFMFKPRLLTGFANLLTRHDSDRPSTVRVSGEYAVSIPNPNTFNEVFVEDYEGIDSSDLMPVSRLSWHASSAPVHGEGLQLDPGDPGYSEYAYLQDHDYAPEQRLETRWFLPKDNTLRRYLNPALKEAEAREAQQVLQIFMSSEGETWTGDHWGGVMRGLGSAGVDLSKTQFLEFWVNDYRHEELGSERTGTLHFDFGYISEDFYWPVSGSTLETGTFQREDGILDGKPNGLWTIDEDVGLGNDPTVDEYDAEYGSSANPFPKINGTRQNNREDTEDLNGNTTFDRQNGFFTISVDLADSALVDVLRDFPASEVDDNLAQNLAWRKYRIRLNDAMNVTPPGGATPYLGAVTHMRIWFEDDEPAPGQTSRKLQFSEIKFLGSRWEREGIRKVPVPEAPEELLLQATDLPAGDVFFIGEVNNKDNPDYTPPFSLHVENKIDEKETSLVVDYQNLDYQHLVRASRLVSTRGEDFTQYGRLVFYVYNPRFEQADMEVFYRVGADTLNFYEVNYRYDASSGARTGWREITLDLAELSNAKLAPRDPVSGWIETEVADALVDQAYRVRVVGAPDLSRVKRLYLGVRNTDQTMPASGYFYFNDVRLREVKKDIGHAERVAVSVSMADAIKVDFDWARQDAEFHGLSQSVGQGFTNEDWNFSTSFKLDDFLPMLGFRMPLSFGKRHAAKRPKYLTNSDIEIIDEQLRVEQTSLNKRENFSVRLFHAPSKFSLLRYLVDPWSVSLSGSRNESAAPLTRLEGESWQGSVSYDLNFKNKHQLGDLPVLSVVPVVKSVSLLPTKMSFSGSFSGSTQRVANYSVLDDDFIKRPVNRSRSGNLSGTVNHKPLPITDVNLTVRSVRDMFRPREIMGMNLGTETVYTHQLQIRFSTPTTLGLPKTWFFKPLNKAFISLKKMRPSLDYQSSFTNDHSLNVMQEGDPPGTRNLQNAGDWTFRASLPLNEVFKKLFPEKTGLSKREEAELIKMRELQMRQDQATGGDVIGREEFEQTVLQDPTLTEAQIQERYDEWLLEQALLMKEEEDRRNQERGEGDDSEETVEADGGGFSIPNPFSPLLTALCDLKPIQINYANKRSSGYGRLQTSAPFWYKLGFAQTIDEPDSLYVSYNTRNSYNLTMSSTTKLSKAMSVDLKFNKNRSEALVAGMHSWSYQQDWPDVNLSVVGLEKLGVLGGGDGLFRSAGLQLNYKFSRSVPTYTAVMYNPRQNRTIAPRLNMTLQSGLTLSFNTSLSSDQSNTAGALALTDRFNANLQIRHTFRAEGLLVRLGLYRPGVQPTVNMDVDISYNKDTTRRWNPSTDFAGEPDTEIGSSRIGVNPRFSYQITRNLSGALRLNYNRNKVNETDSVTSSFGLGMEATFVF